MAFIPTSQKESQIHAAIDNLLHAARQLNEMQDNDIEPASMAEIASVLFEENSFSTHTETILFLKDLLRTYKEFERADEEVFGRYERV